VLTFEEAKDVLREQLRLQKHDELAAELSRRLQEQANVTIYEQTLQTLSRRRARRGGPERLIARSRRVVSRMENGGVMKRMAFKIRGMDCAEEVAVLQRALGPVASILLYLGSVVSGAWFVAPKALYAVRTFRPDMNLLMLVAVAGAMAIGEWFEAAAVAFLFSLALLLEAWSVGRARLAIKALVNLSPTTARCVAAESGEVVEKPVDEAHVGSTVLVRPGEKIPLDGVVTEGSTAVNQAPITGESVPISKVVGDEVFAGTINGDGVFTLRTTKPATDTSLAHIIHLLEEAHARRAPSEQWVENPLAHVVLKKAAALDLTYTPAANVTAL
jgi:cation transport ATPase